MGASISLTILTSSMLVGCSGLPKHAVELNTPKYSQHASKHDLREARQSYAIEDQAEPSIRLTLNRQSKFEDYIQFALRHHPGLEASRLRWLEENARVAQVKALPDPKIKLGYFAQEVETRVGPQKFRIGIQQAFPWPGTLSNRQESARNFAIAAQKNYEAKHLEVIKNLQLAFYDYAYAVKTLSILKENKALYGALEEAVRIRYQLGAGEHPDLIRVQLELATYEDRIENAEEAKISFLSHLNSVLDRPAESEIEELPSFDILPIEQPKASLLSLALNSQPNLQALTVKEKAFSWQVKAAQSEGMPSFSLGLDYISTDRASNSVSGSGDDPVLLSLALSIPIWRSKVRSKVNQAQSARLRTLSLRRELENQISASLYENYFRHQDACRRIELYRNTLIPKSQESFAAYLGSYRSGKASFSDLIDSQSILVEYEIHLENEILSQRRSFANILFLIGGDAGLLSASDIKNREEKN